MTLKKSKPVTELEDLDLRIVELISHSNLVKGYGSADADDGWDIPEKEIEILRLNANSYELIADEIDTGYDIILEIQLLSK